MDQEDAKNRLFIHGSFLPNDPEWSNCFLGKLKPYRHRLGDEIYDDILNCLKAVYDEITSQDHIDVRIVAGVHGILHSGRMWLGCPESGLRKSGRIPDEEVTRLLGWLDNISSVYQTMLMVKSEKEHLFNQYKIN